ncbi:MAG: hypothetical protein ACREH4_11040 [Vitreimonas sp.]
MTHSGGITGTTTTHVRDWGRQQAILNDMTLSAGETSYPYENRMIIDGLRIVTIDANGVASATAATDNNQDAPERHGRSWMEHYEHVMIPIGARRTGETGSFAGQRCEYWEIPSLGARDCITSWGWTLYRTNTIVDVGEEAATEVRIGDGGPDAAFAYDPSRIVEEPNPLTDPRFPDRKCELNETTGVLTCHSVEPPRSN